MKKVLVLYYSQSGQLERVMDRVVEPLQASDDVQCDYRRIEPVKPYPYPWSFYTFFNVFPEAVGLDGCEVEPVDAEGEYDLVILGYTAWFLSPSTPVTGFLKSDQGRKLLAGKPVVTVIACRNMWLMAQEKMKGLLADIGARLIDNVVLTDQGDALYTFVTTPRWMLTGKKEGFWFFPPAGISEEEIAAATRFGDRLRDALKNNEEKGDGAMLRGLGAVNVNGKLIASEKIGNRSFTIWSRLLKRAGAPNSLGRNAMMTVYIIFLLILIVTVVPLNILIRKLIYPWRKESIDKEVAYFEEPSGKY